MGTSINHSRMEEGRQDAQRATGESSAQLQRLGLAMLAPMLRRLIASFLPIQLNPISEVAGAVETAPPVEVAPKVETTEEKQPRPLPQEQSHVVRFDTHQRIQHILMMTSFLTLAFTGLPQKFAGAEASRWFITALGGLEAVQAIHHFAAWVMLFDCLYHGCYLLYTIALKKRITPLRMLPMPKDIRDAAMMFSYFLGLSKEKPKFDRFSYLEKFDYWAVFWGIAIIGGSGIVLMFPVLVSKGLPGQIIPVALAAHSDEALLAVGWIFVVHFFYAHLVPRIFPFNTSIFTGKVSTERYIEEHPLEWERMVATRKGAATKAARRAEPKPIAASRRPEPKPAPTNRRPTGVANVEPEDVIILGKPEERGARD